MAEEKCRFRFSRSVRNYKQSAGSIMEAIAKFSGGEAEEDGRVATRMKIVVKREDLKQVLEAIRDGRRVSNLPPALSLEQRLNSMRRRQALRAACQVKGRSRDLWMPVLQSIPEEV